MYAYSSTRLEIIWHIVSSKLTSFVDQLFQAGFGFDQLFQDGFDQLFHAGFDQLWEGFLFHLFHPSCEIIARIKIEN